MAITIEHTYSTSVEIIYYSCENDTLGLHEKTVGTMDDVSEHICEILVKHNFVGADVCSAETGEVLMIITRS